eukprot:5893376-Amphidinium_carterae.1
MVGVPCTSGRAADNHVMVWANVVLTLCAPQCHQMPASSQVSGFAVAYNASDTSKSEHNCYDGLHLSSSGNTGRSSEDIIWCSSLQTKSLFEFLLLESLHKNRILYLDK